MSEGLVRRLQVLEEDFLEMPPLVRRKDLPEINRLRAELGMPQVDEHLKEVGSGPEAAPEQAEGESPNATQNDFPDEPVVAPTQPQPASDEPVADHTKSQEIYQAYLEKVEHLKPHWAYAKQVAKATSGRGQTPVRPLATMGNNGGPLLCDQCRKPIVLEGGKFNNVTADVAWRRYKDLESRDKWTSYIAGGLVVEVQSNGTLRIYHGYPGQNDRHCCNIASRELAQARAAFDSSERSRIWPELLEFLRFEFPEMELQDRTDLLNKILDLMFEYDPGLGFNRPDADGVSQK